DAHAVGRGDLDRAILAERIEDHDIIAPGDRFQATADVDFLIECEDQDGDRHSFSPGGRRSPIVRAGLPATICMGGTSLTTTARAPTIAPLPTVTPGPMNASVPIQTLSSMVTEGFSNGRVGSLKSCVPAQTWAR